MLKTPSAFGTSPKYDDSNSESFCKRFIVVFGGGWVGAGVAARVESLRGRMSEGERQVEGLFESLRKMKAKSNDLYITPPLSLQGEFAGLVDSLQVQPFQG
jgi:hypothetical protein